MWRNKSLGALLVFATAVALAQAQQPNSCVDCHSALEGELHVTQEQFAQDIHAQKGLTCASTILPCAPTNWANTRPACTASGWPPATAKWRSAPIATEYTTCARPATR